eukprot:3856791-Pyramimonas_sp.AAC.1
MSGCPYLRWFSRGGKFEGLGIVGVLCAGSKRNNSKSAPWQCPESLFGKRTLPLVDPKNVCKSVI